MMSWLFGKQWQYNESIEGRTAVVTGSNCGIGYHTALELYKRGGRVILAGRNVSKLNEAKQRIKRSRQDGVGELDIVELDLSSLESVRKCAKLLLTRERAIHILVNNAANDINLEDINCEKSYFYHTVYSQTKLANILFSNELVKRLKAAGVNDVTVYSVNPGAVDTKLSDEFASMILPGVRWLFRRLKLMFMQSPAQGATTTVYCAVAEDVAHQSGLFYTNCKVAVPPKSTKNEEKAKQLWDLSLAMTHLDTNINIFTPE